jgi:hypothetical protein
MKKTSNYTFIVFLISASLLAACSQAAVHTVEPNIPVAMAPTMPSPTIPATLATSPTIPIYSATPLPLPAEGNLAPGTYFFSHRSISDYKQIIFTLPTGWSTKDGFVYKHLGEPDEMAISAWVPDQVYADPCHWQGSALGPLDLANHYNGASGEFILTPADGGLANQAFRGPVPLTLTGVMIGGEPALRIDLSVPANLDISTCDHGQFRSWTDSSVVDGANSHHASGQFDAVYEVDLDRKALVIDASHLAASSEADLAELDAILASMFINRDWSVETSAPSSSNQKAGPATWLEGQNSAAVVQGTLLNPGTYDYINVDGQGFNVRFTVPSGWTWNGRFLSKGGFDQPDRASIFFLGGRVQVYADSCHWGEPESKSSWVTGLSFAYLMAALADQPMRNATTPIDRRASSMGLANHWPGKAVELTTADEFNVYRCYGAQYRSWGPETNFWSHVDPGQHDYVWAVDISGVNITDEKGEIIATPPPGGLIIDAASFPGTPADVMSEIETILGSIVVGHWG